MRGLSDTVLRRALNFYGLTYNSTLDIISGYRNTSHLVDTNRGPRNLVLYKNERGIKVTICRVNDIGAFLYRRDLPVRAPSDLRILRLSGRGTARYASLYPMIPGDTIAWEMYSMKHIKLLGWAMGDMHAALVEYGGALPDVIEEYVAIVERMKLYVARPGVETAMRDKLGLAINLAQIDAMISLLGTLRQLPAQALHVDFVRGNILFGSNMTCRHSLGSTCLTGILDLEKAARGPVVMDAARTLAFLYVDCASKTPEKIFKYFVVSGYNKRSAARLETAQDTITLLDQLITMFLTYDFYKFLRDNPYESLANNHHFIRTRDMLVTRKVLQYI